MLVLLELRMLHYEPPGACRLDLVCHFLPTSSSKLANFYFPFVVSGRRWINCLRAAPLRSFTHSEQNHKADHRSGNIKQGWNAKHGALIPVFGNCRSLNNYNLCVLLLIYVHLWWIMYHIRKHFSLFPSTCAEWSSPPQLAHFHVSSSGYKDPFCFFFLLRKKQITDHTSISE